MPPDTSAINNESHPKYCCFKITSFWDVTLCGFLSMLISSKDGSRGFLQKLVLAHQHQIIQLIFQKMIMLMFTAMETTVFDI
jgi:hypothetical protein